jgi:HAD superfamily hydrolase (TIGR01509 family)
MAKTVILDIDGTLVDTNYQHAIAWHRALREHGHKIQVWKIHRHIGMGGDQILTALIGEEAERTDGDAIREAEGKAYAQLIGEVEPLQGATDLLEDLQGRELTSILASSAKSDEVEHYLDLLGARDLVDGWTTSADVENTKPEPDLVNAALAKAGGPDPADALMIGDSVWDVKAATAAGVATLAVLTGGFSEEELREAGAAGVAREVSELAGPLSAWQERAPAP